MKVKYMHIADPGVEKIHDTVKSLQGCIGLIHACGSDRTQEEWNQEELQRFERDLQKGIILSYEVIKEEEK